MPCPNSTWYAGVPCSWMSSPSSSPSFDTRSVPVSLDEVHQAGDAADDDDARDAPDELRLQLVDAPAVEQALHDGGRVDAVGGGDAELSRGEQTERSASPRCRQMPWTATAPTGSSTRMPSMRSTPSGTTMPAMPPIRTAPNGETQ